MQAVESPTPKSSTKSLLQRKAAFVNKRTRTTTTKMSTRSGARYRGGAAAPVDENAEGNSLSTEGAGTGQAPVNSTATVVPAADETSSPETKKPSFSWKDARRTLFPIHGKDEVQKFLLIGMIKFFIIMALTLTRDTKDTLVVTQCGAEAIAFLKVSIVATEMTFDDTIFFYNCRCSPINFSLLPGHANRFTVSSLQRQLSLPYIQKCRMYWARKHCSSRRAFHSSCSF